MADPRLRFTAAAAVAAAAVALAGCSSPPGPSTDYLSDATQAHVAELVRALNYPFDSDPTYAVQVGNLQTRLINDCVARQGVVPPAIKPLPLEADSVVPSAARLWLIPGDDYGVSTLLSDPKAVALLHEGDAGNEQGESVVPDPEAYDRAVYGADNERISFPIEGGGTSSVPVGGCFGEATQAMYGVPAADYERAYYEIPSIRKVMTETLADSAVGRATSAWSSCMGKAGHNVGSPTDLYGEMNRWISGVVEGTSTVTQAEQDEAKLASTDKSCRTSSGLGTAVADRFVALAEAEIAGKEGVVVEYRAMIEHAQSLLDKG